MNSIKINNIKIGRNYRPVIIAEMSGNHNQSIKRALQIVDEAAKAGADMIKLQTYTPDTMTLDIDDKEFFIDDRDSLWDGQSLHQLYKKAHTPWEWHKEIFEYANKLGLVCFSSPFDSTAVDFLETLNAPLYKIASFENTDLELIKKVASTGKPMIVSTGMATISELDETVSIIKNLGCKDLILLKCTSTYPADPINSNILRIPHMQELFKCQIGLSDHTMGIGTAVAAVTLGATIIEKHFTLSRDDGGVDAEFSIEPNEMKLLVQETNRAWQALGSVTYGPTKAEEASLKFRRSIYISKDLKKGEKLNQENIKIIRPGNGLKPKYYNQVLGKTINANVKKGTPITWELIK